MARLNYSKTKGWEDFDDILTTEDVAALLKIEIHTVRKLAMTGEIPGLRIGKQWRFDKSAIKSKLQSNAITKIEEAS